MQAMNAIILSIGDELTLGQTVDTNSAWLSQQLAAVGCGVSAHVTVSDDQAAIEDAIREAILKCDFLLISGGLGPTEDDLTRQALAAVMNVELELNARWLAELEKFFTARGRPMPPANRIQAMIPRGAKMIFNHAGTAAGIEANLPRVAAVPEGRLPLCHVSVMPGVPKEMKIMFTRDVLPHVKAASGGAAILSRTLHTFGLGESALAELLGDLMRRDRNPSVGTTVSGGVVSLRVNSRFPSADEAKQNLDSTVAHCHAALGDLIYGEDEQTLQAVVGGMLKRRKPPVTVATAESCTGGLLAKMLTDNSGSSAYFHRGWVTYSNEAKQELLGVPPEIIEKYGAVSEQTVTAMAANARRLADSNFALAISGIAGPDGGSAEKPVGTTCIAIARESNGYVRQFVFPGDREFVRERAAKMALTMLRFELLGKPMPF